MLAVAVVEADPVADDGCGGLNAVEALAVDAPPFSAGFTRPTIPFSYGQYGVMNSCFKPWLQTCAVERRRV